MTWCPVRGRVYATSRTVRATDVTPAGHVSNAVHWQAAEDLLAGFEWLPAAAELEYHQPILPEDNPQLLASHAPDRVLLWLVNDRGRLASGRLARMPLTAG